MEIFGIRRGASEMVRFDSVDKIRERFTHGGIVDAADCNTSIQDRKPGSWYLVKSVSEGISPVHSFHSV